MRVNRTIYLVDDDAAVCHALSVFLSASGYSARIFPSAEAFLEVADNMVEGVMLLDQRMGGMSGMELQNELVKRGSDLSIIFISGHGNVQMSVKAMKAGATNFLEKPFSNEDLLASISEAFLYLDSNKKQHDLAAEAGECYASLTDREREVLKYVVDGMSNKDLAERLGVSNRTVEVHRSRGMKKMKAESLPDLVRRFALCQKAGRL